MTGVGGFPHIADEDNAVWAAFGVTSQPRFAFIDDDGSVEVVRLPIGELSTRVEALLAS